MVENASWAFKTHHVDDRDTAAFFFSWSLQRSYHRDSNLSFANNDDALMLSTLVIDIGGVELVLIAVLKDGSKKFSRPVHKQMPKIRKDTLVAQSRGTGKSCA